MLDKLHRYAVLSVLLILVQSTYSGLAWADSEPEAAADVESPAEEKKFAYQPKVMTEEQIKQYPFKRQKFDYEIKPLNTGQEMVLTNWRRQGKDLLARKMGILNIRGTYADLGKLQQLIDRRVIRDNEVELWQSIGVLFGDILASKFNLHWVSYEDRKGANKVLRWRKTENYLFPITMFSKRVRFGQKINVFEMYDKLEKSVADFKAYELRPKLPHPRSADEFM